MSNLLTTTEYQAIAKDLSFPQSAFIDGKYRVGHGTVFASINPANGDTLTEIVSCDKSDVDFAVTKAREVFDQGHWAKLNPSERKSIMIRLCKLITRNSRELAVMESIDSGNLSLTVKQSIFPKQLKQLNGMRSLLIRCMTKRLQHKMMQ